MDALTGKSDWRKQGVQRQHEHNADDGCFLAVLPRCHVYNLRILHDIRLRRWANLAHNQLECNLEHEQEEQNIQVMTMNREQRGLGQRVQYNVQNQTGLRCDRRGVLGEHADDDGRQNRHVEEAEAGLQEVIQTGRSQADSRRNANGNDCEHDAEALANTHQMFVRSVRVEQRAMQHLAAAGCRSVSFVGQPDYSTAFSQRYFSYLAVASQLPVETPDDMLIGRPDKEMNELIAELTQRIGARETLPDAFYCANDYIAIMLIRALTTQGISIPEQVSIIGVDNNPVSALVSPQLCSLDIQCEQQAHYALRRMTELLHDKTSEPVRLLIQPRLIPGASVQHA